MCQKKPLQLIRPNAKMIDDRNCVWSSEEHEMEFCCRAVRGWAIHCSFFACANAANLCAPIANHRFEWAAWKEVVEEIQPSQTVCWGKWMEMKRCKVLEENFRRRQSKKSHFCKFAPIRWRSEFPFLSTIQQPDDDRRKQTG